MGESVTRVDATIHGGSTEMGFNYRFISDVLGQIPTDSINLVFDEQTKTLLMKPIPDSKFNYLVKYMKTA